MFNTELSKLLLRIDENTLVISDTHFNHIGVTQWETCRLKAMHNDGMGLYIKGDEEALNTAHTEWIIKNWNSVVKPNDIIIHLGDLAWKGHREIIPRLNGIKILILGNHDKKGPNTYDQFDHVIRGYYKIKNGRLSIVESTDALFSCLQIEEQGVRILLSHYPATEEEFRFKKVLDDETYRPAPFNKRIDALINICKDEYVDLNIHGHTHSTSYNFDVWSFKNVSIEAINFKPITIQECINDC